MNLPFMTYCFYGPLKLPNLRFPLGKGKLRHVPNLPSVLTVLSWWDRGPGSLRTTISHHMLLLPVIWLLLLLLALAKITGLVSSPIYIVLSFNAVGIISLRASVRDTSSRAVGTAVSLLL